MGADDTHHVQCEGAALKVVLTKKVAKAFSNVDARQRGPLERWMKIMASEGVQDIPGDRLKFETRVRISGTDVAVYALREHQTRLYGALVQGVHPPTYLFAEIDVAKKQNKADPSKLRRAAELLHEHVIKH